MSKSCAAAAAAIVLACVSTPARAVETLSLQDAFARVEQSHPDLAVLRFREAAISAERARAAQRPALNAVLGAENLLGTGSASGLHSAELSLSLASVIERGGKRDARMALAASRYDAVDLLRQARQLDLYAEVARRYLDAAAAEAEQHLAEADIGQRERTEIAAQQRVSAGGAAPAVVLAARAAKLRAIGQRDRSERARLLANRRLALLWGSSSADFSTAGQDLALLPAAVDFADLVERLEQTPELRTFAHEARLREARLQLARSQRSADVEWQVGVRRLQAESDWALIGSVSMPLGSAARAAPEIDSVEAEVQALGLEREGARIGLLATLAEAQGKLEAAVAEAGQLDRELIPLLQQAEQAAETAYRRGALSHLEWSQLQSETHQARRQRLAASLEAHRALIELQRLTGATLGPAGDSTLRTH